MCYTPKELFEFPNSYRQKSGGQMWEWRQIKWGNHGINKDQTEFINMTLKAEILNLTLQLKN